MNMSRIGHGCVCIFRRHAVVWRSPRCAILQLAMMTGTRRDQCRNMSIWYFAKKRIQRAWSEQVKMESFDTIKKFGLEVGVCHMLIKMGARVQFTNGNWYTKQDIKRGSLPLDELEGQSVIAIDAMDTDLDQFSMADLVKLSAVKYLSLEGCAMVDDHCLASLVHLRDTLTHLNINNCEQVTENGIATLHKLRNLERLNMNNMPKVKFAPLVAVMLEDVLPRLRISLVTKQVDKYVEEARKGAKIIEDHRRQAGLNHNLQDDLGDLRNRIKDGDHAEDSPVHPGISNTR
ncbi:distal membrane-arm assembly complex protein 2-like [Lytechinus pictus]|uniref:distal membrane-arm assembly complex protein 2-like n=1 Tax=Lytechinus pictus TaxID=7653 RepID=UPI0030B9DF3D